jgi:Fe-S cluster biogenesis protein NfuA/nitrite reductase/ring-hydroxylating ferredoxin subunit
MAGPSADKEFHQRIGRLEALLQQIDKIADAAAREKTREIVQILMEFHGAGLAKIMDLIGSHGQAGPPVLDALARDDLVGNLLLLYDLHPLSYEDRIKQALEKVRPYLKSHKGNVELVAVRDGVVHLRMAGSCHGCPSSAMTLKLAIEEAIYEKAPDTLGIEVEGVVEPPAPHSNFVPIEQLTAKNGHHRADKAASWVGAEDVSPLAEGTVRRSDVGEHSLLFCRAAGVLYAYASDCPACGIALDKALLFGTVLTCPGCGRRYDIQHAGRSVDGGDAHLEPVPLLEEAGRVKVAVTATTGTAGVAV